jgi:hypothetical protein
MPFIVFAKPNEMNVIQQLIDAVHQTTAEERCSAKAFHDAIENGLRRKGWKVVREFRVRDRGDGAPGRIDLVVISPLRIGIELDNAITRKKSLFKLSHFDGLGIVILRKSGRIITCKRRPGRAAPLSQVE